MSRNSLYTLIGVLAVIIVGFGIYFIYQEQNKPKLEIKMDQNGVSVTGNG